MAEWLGNGLQIRVPRFNSARRLQTCSGLAASAHAPGLVPSSAVETTTLGRRRRHGSGVRRRWRETRRGGLRSLLRYDDPDRLEFAPAVVGETALEVLKRWDWDLTPEATRIAKDLGSSSAASRSSAIEALVMLGAREHTATIAKGTQDGVWAVRRDALWALAVFGATDHAHAAAVALADDEPTIRAQALWTLGVLRSRAHRGVVKSFEDDRTLGCCVAASTSPLPTRCVGRQSTLSDFAREALERMGPE